MKLSDYEIASLLHECKRAGIKNPAAFLQSKRPIFFDFLRGAFPRGIMPTDIDGEVEIGGHFLRLEFKAEDIVRGTRGPRGQRKAFMRLIATRRFTVFIIGTDALDRPTCIEIFRPNGRWSPVEDADHAKVIALCRAWADYAGRTCPPLPP